jgi:large subunit ribosomal protein L24
MRIRRGDNVVVIAGNDKGSVPRRVIQIKEGGKKLVVEGINRVQKHVKRGHPKSPQGGRLTIEMPIDASNVMLFCSSCNSKTRAGYKYEDDGKKLRVCRKCQAAIGAPMSPPRKRYAKAAK